jgi:hypothetical protein
MDPMLMQGDVVGDGEIGAAEPGTQQDPELAMATMQQEEILRQTLLQTAYGDQSPERQSIDRD